MGKGVLPAHGEEWGCKIILLNCLNFLTALSAVISQYVFKDISVPVLESCSTRAKGITSTAVSHRSAVKEVMGCRTDVRLQAWRTRCGQRTVEMLN